MEVLRELNGLQPYLFVFFFNDTATTEIYTLSLHDALPICDVLPAPRRDPERRGRRAARTCRRVDRRAAADAGRARPRRRPRRDRKSTRLNSSHSQISYAVFCLNKTTTTS